MSPKSIRISPEPDNEAQLTIIFGVTGATAVAHAVKEVASTTMRMMYFTSILSIKVRQIDRLPGQRMRAIG
jgi:hypothetical protein